MARIYLKEARYTDAVSIYQELIKRHHKTAELYYNLAMALRMQEKYDDSIKYFNKSLELNPSDAECLDALASAFAATGNFDEAARIAEKALIAAKVSGRDDLVADIQKRMELYQAGMRHK